MTTKQILFIGLLLVINALVFCGGALFLTKGFSITAPSKPTDTQVVFQLPPTYTPTPTIAPKPPTPTAVPPSPNPAVAKLSSAMSKARLATSYRLAMDMTMKGDLKSMAPTAGAASELTMLGMTGEVSGKDSHFVVKGLVGVIFTGDVNKGMEMIQAGGKSYVRGPLPLLGAKDSRWYVLPQSASGSSPAAGAEDMLPVFGESNMDLDKFMLSGQETLDKVKCDIYSADKATALQSFSSLSSSAQLNQGELSTLQTHLRDAEFSIWVCADGYLHQMRMSFLAQDPKNASQTIGLKLELHVYDFGSKIPIAAPANAIPASMPFVSTLTPAPKAAPTRTPTPQR